MGARYLIDTNVFSKYLNNLLPESTSDLLDKIEYEISIISRIELLSWRGITEVYLSQLNTIFDNSLIYPLDEEIVLKTIEIRKKYKLKLPDAVIAATAISNKLILISSDLEFEKIYGLKTLNPFNK
jgi:predicted nucleic acid-binding protein